MSPDTPLVLLVDDNADIRELYGLVLTNAGFQVIDAPDGEVAVELARSARPNAIVMDIDMPRMNGLDAIRLLRQQTHTSRTPILAFTGHGVASAAAALSSGANLHCLKPCLPDTFVDSLRSILAGPSEMEQVRR
jgi:CheY-like chemotaxis protein